MVETGGWAEKAMRIEGLNFEVEVDVLEEVVDVDQILGEVGCSLTGMEACGSRIG